MVGEIWSGDPLADRLEICKVRLGVCRDETDQREDEEFGETDGAGGPRRERRKIHIFVTRTRYSRRRKFPTPPLAGMANT